MAHNDMLNAGNDPMWLHVTLTARRIHLDTLRTLAEAWRENRETAIDAMDQLIKGLDRVEGGWDAAVWDLQSNLRLDDADTAELTANEARQLASELLAAADRTSESRRAADRPRLFLPQQQDRRAA